MKRLTLGLALALNFTSCGKEASKVDPTTNKPSKENQSSWLLNSWEGAQSSKQSNPDSRLSDAKVTLSFMDQQRFHISYGNDEQAHVEGRYYDSDQKIIFAITDSTVSTFGKSGTNRTMQYEVFGEKLHIYDQELELILVKKSSPVKTSDAVLFKSWGCEQGNLYWNLKLQPQTYNLVIGMNGSPERLERSGRTERASLTEVPNVIINFFDKAGSAIRFSGSIQADGTMEATATNLNREGQSVTFTCR